MEDNTKSQKSPPWPPLAVGPIHARFLNTDSLVITSRDPRRVPWLSADCWVHLPGWCLGVCWGVLLLNNDPLCLVLSLWCQNCEYAGMDWWREDDCPFGAYSCGFDTFPFKHIFYCLVL